MSFGQNPFGISSFGESYEQADASFTLTGVAGTSALGTATASAEALQVPTGVAGTASTNTLTLSGKALQVPTGAVGTSALGTIVIAGGAGTLVTISGTTLGTGVVNGITFGGDANVLITGVQALAVTDDPGYAGDEVVIDSEALVVIAGVAGTGAANTVTAKAGAVGTGTVSAIGSIGSFTIVAKSVLTLAGASGTVSTNSVSVSCPALALPIGLQGAFTIGDETITAVQFDYESIKTNYSRDRTAYIGEINYLSNTVYVRAA
mgnify:FL=1